ncbi:hypothetical protein, partial [Escherichia coli]|uniref:hypothetical protein n=1 Tax=Escherichia coli TaxID=562 RepID=UPI000A56179E
GFNCYLLMLIGGLAGIRDITESGKIVPSRITGTGFRDRSVQPVHLTRRTHAARIQSCHQQARMRAIADNAGDKLRHGSLPGY